MEDFLLVVGISICVAIVVVCRLAARNDAPRSNQTLQDYVATIQGFTSAHLLVSCDKQSALAMNATGSELCLVRRLPSGRPTHRALTTASILESEIFEDAETVTSTSRGSQLGGALVGGLVAGPAGAIIGGLSGKTSQHRTVSSMGLRLRIADIASPMHELKLISHPVQRDSFIYSGAARAANEWHARIAVAIRNAAKS